MRVGIGETYLTRPALGKLIPMPADFAAAFATLKPVLAKYEKRLRVKTDTPIEC